MRLVKRVAVFLFVWILMGVWILPGSLAVEAENLRAVPATGSADGGDGLPELTLYAQSAVLIDGDSGRILYGKGQDTVRPMASTTKIMTCILALERGNLQSELLASQEAASQPKVRLGVRKGESYQLKDLLYALMLESYNDAAVVIAEGIGGSTKGFADMMNEKARALGCENTYFVTPNGLDGKEIDEMGAERIHATTASELARIMRYCVMESPKREEFLEITRAGNYSFTNVSGTRSFQCYNHNAFLNMMEGALSGKTGFTGGAGYSYVGALENEGRTYIIALLGCGWPPHKTYKWSDARKLYTYGLEHFTLKNVFKPEALSPVAVKGGLCWEGEGRTGSTRAILGAKEGEELPVLLREGEKVQVRERLPSIINAPVKAGQLLGEVEYSIDGQILENYGIYAGDTVEKLTLRRAAGHVLDCFLFHRVRPAKGLKFGG